jgi:hypothetical protein
VDLQWLARNQANDGSWRNAGGYGTYPAAMTGLAGMAFVRQRLDADARQVLAARCASRSTS